MLRLEVGQFESVTVEGGPGDSIDRAVVIRGIREKTDAVPVEHAILLQEFGDKDKDWQVQMRSIQKHRGRTYDVLDIVLNDRRRTTYYFDVTDFNYEKEPFETAEVPSFLGKLWTWMRSHRS